MDSKDECVKIWKETAVGCFKEEYMQSAGGLKKSVRIPVIGMRHEPCNAGRQLL
jgi:hypothetical protein